LVLAALILLTAASIGLSLAAEPAGKSSKDALPAQMGVPGVAWNRFLFPAPQGGKPSTIPVVVRILEPGVVLPDSLKDKPHECYAYGFGYADIEVSRAVVFMENMYCFQSGTLPPSGVFRASVSGRLYGGQDFKIDVPAKPLVQNGKTEGLLLDRGTSVLVQMPFLKSGVPSAPKNFPPPPVKRSK